MSRRSSAREVYFSQRGKVMPSASKKKMTSILVDTAAAEGAVVPLKHNKSARLAYSYWEASGAAGWLVRRGLVPRGRRVSPTEGRIQGLKEPTRRPCADRFAKTSEHCRRIGDATPRVTDTDASPARRRNSPDCPLLAGQYIAAAAISALSQQAMVDPSVLEQCVARYGLSGGVLAPWLA